MTSITFRRQSGFTLVELLIVVLIIGILATIAIPVFNGQRNKAKNSVSQSAVRNALTAAASFATTSDSYVGLQAGLNGQESSLTGVASYTTAEATPGTGATPTNILVTRAGSTPVSAGVAPDETNAILCSVAKGDKWFCIYRPLNGTQLYKSGTGVLNNAAIGTTNPVNGTANWSSAGF